MMDWTDRHCRFFHRIMTRRALLYTEMVTAEAILHGKRDQLLAFDAAEHPVALQLGGSDPAKLAEAAAIGEDYGYDEINLNVGCPSDRVQEGRFGACLMAEPDLVAAVRRGDAARVSQFPSPSSAGSASTTRTARRISSASSPRSQDAGVRILIVHARKAWLKGLSPKENREVPPLDYARVYRLKQRHPDMTIAINGGIASLDAAQQHLASRRWRHARPRCLSDAVSAGRSRSVLLCRRHTGVVACRRAGPVAALRRGRILREVGGSIISCGISSASITASRVRVLFRRHLSEHAVKAGADLDVYDEAIRIVENERARAHDRIASAAQPVA